MKNNETSFSGGLIPNTESLHFSVESAFALAAHSSLAYDTKENIVNCLTNRGFDTVKYFTDKEKRTPQDTQAYLAATADIIIVAFRGSEGNIEDWFGANARVLPKQIPWLNDDDLSAHSGFIDALTNKGQSTSSILNEILDEIEKNSIENGRQKQIFLTGHSLGGALATLMALKLRGILVQPVANAQNTNDGFALREVRSSCPLAVYTFGSPRVVTSKLAIAYDTELKAVTHRLVHENDVVTQIPFYRWGYTHVGSHVQLESSGKVSSDPINSESSLGGLGWGLKKVLAFSTVLTATARGGIGDHSIGKGPTGKDGPVPDWLSHVIRNGGYLGALGKAVKRRETARL